VKTLKTRAHYLHNQDSTYGKGILNVCYLPTIASEYIFTIMAYTLLKQSWFKQTLLAHRAKAPALER